MAGNRRPEPERPGESTGDSAQEPVDLTIDPDTVCFLAVKAREFDAKVEPDDPDSGSNPSDDRAIDVLEDRRDDATQAEIMGILEVLNEDELAELVAITWIGRGDYGRDDWAEAIDQARQRGSGSTADYLLGMPLLGDYLENGLNEIGHSCGEIEAEHL